MAEVERARSGDVLLQTAYKHFSQAIEPGLISLNPTLELIAVATTEKQLDVFRFGGQRAFGTRAHRDKPSISALCWKYDGSELAVWWSDNMWQTIESSTGAIGPLTPFFCEDVPEVPKINCTMWEAKIVNPIIRRDVATADEKLTEASNSTSESGSNLELDRDKDEIKVSIAELLSPDVSKESSRPAVDHLPTLLASFTVRDELPRLSALPHVSNHDLNTHTESIVNIFSRQELLDRVINFVGSGLSDVMDFLVVGYGGAHLSIGQGSRKISLCCMDVPGFIHTQKEYKLVSYATHPSASCQAVLTSAVPSDRPQEYSNSSFGVHFTSLNAIQKSGHYLPLVIQAVAQLSNLDRYIAFSIAAIREAWNGSREIFSRYIQSIEETLSDRGDTETQKMDLITALYRLAVTGDCEPAIEEWMKDIMGLKGVERWSNTLPEGLVNVVDLIHGNLLPALDRASIEASRLRAMCRNQSAPICKLSEKSLTQILDDLDTIRLLANAALLYARQEIPQIEAFATFMRCHIQVMKEPDSTSAKEATETIANLDYALLLSFITGAMTKSHLNVFLGREVAMVRNAPRRPKQHAPKKIILSMLDRHSQNPMQTTTPVVEFVNLLYQSWFLSDTVDEIRTQFISQFSNASVAAHQVPLDWDEISPSTDIRMTVTKPPFYDKSGSLLPIQCDECMATYVVGVPERTRDQLRVHRILHKAILKDMDAAPKQVEDSYRVTVTHGIATLPNCTVWDVKFVGNGTLILLLSNQAGQTYLLQFPVFRFWELSNLKRTASERADRAAGSTRDSSNPPPHKFLNEDSQNTFEVKTVQVNLSDLEPYILCDFKNLHNSNVFVPRLMQVCGPGHSSKNLLLLDESTTKYKVFDLRGITWRWG